jgi:DNA (cytosine-5)-methyltransferase 1
VSLPLGAKDTGHAVAFTCKDHGADSSHDGAAPTLRAMGHASSHANGGGQLAIAIQETATATNPASGPGGAGHSADGAAYTLEARSTVQAVAFAENARGELRLTGGDGGVPAQLTTGGGKPGQGLPHILAPSAAPLRWIVRRLTPLECERLQGFPDDWTLVPGKPSGRRKIARPLTDSPRYTAIGNSMAVNVMSWLGTRIQMMEDAVAGLDPAHIPPPHGAAASAAHGQDPR